ncbi:hypothetical protein D3C81_1739440 [compost metagenome]
MRPAVSPAASPAPQKKSARTPPLMAEPVSCANIRRWIGSVESGHVVERNTGTPSGIVAGSTAIDRSAVSGTPSAPTGPSLFGGSSRKKT